MMSLIFWLIIIYLAFSFLKKIGSKTNESNLKSSNISNGDVDLEKKEVESEAVRIRREAEKRKEEAEELELDKLLIDFFEETKYYSSWIKNKDNKFELPSLILSINEIIDKKYNEKKYSLLLKTGNEYIIRSKEGTYISEVDMNPIDIDIEKDGKIIFSVGGQTIYNEWSSEIQTFGINKYNPNEVDWVEEFKTIMKQAREIDERKEKDDYEDPETLQKIKDDFGIE